MSKKLGDSFSPYDGDFLESFVKKVSLREEISNADRVLALNLIKSLLSQHRHLTTLVRIFLKLFFASPHPWVTIGDIERTNRDFVKASLGLGIDLSEEEEESKLRKDTSRSASYFGSYECLRGVPAVVWPTEDPNYLSARFGASPACKYWWEILHLPVIDFMVDAPFDNLSAGQVAPHGVHLNREAPNRFLP